MNIKTVITLLAIVVPCAAQAQNRQYTMAEATNGIVTNLAPKGVKGASWVPGTHRLTFMRNDTTFRLDAATNLLKPMVTPAGPPAIELSDNSWYVRDGDKLEVSITSADGKINTTSYTLPKDATNLKVLPGKPVAAFTSGNNLLLATGGQVVPLTADKDVNIISGQAVHRNEFGIDNGIFWSPKGSYLAYYRMDQTMVNDYPVIDWSVVPARNENVKYPMAGGTSHQVTLQVYDPARGTTVGLQTGKGKDHYLTCISWSPDERYIYLALLNRKQNHLWLNQYDAKTGERLKTLFEEKDEKYVEPQHSLTFLPGSNDQFIWWSQRDGYMHLYLCDIKANTIRCLTPGKYVVNELLGFNAKRKELLITSAKEDPREKHGYAVNWETGKMRRLDTEPGTHNYTASDDGAYLYDVLTFEGDINGTTADVNAGSLTMGTAQADSLNQLRIPKRSLIRDISGRVVKVLANAPNPLADFDRPIIRNTVLKASDGTPLYGKLILPTHFDRTKKYPVIVYLYNGPHVQLIKNGFPGSGNLWYEYLAQHGYIVWTMDGRGSSNRGLKFEQAVFRRLGTIEMEDQMVGVNFLKSLSYVDQNRMGIHGWSFGGFMTTSFMLRKPGVFKVAVAGGPVMDWSMYEVMYGERYMDTPQENPKGYADNNLLTKAKSLKGKLLLIHGAQDATVVWQHSINFLKKSVDENVQVDYFVYPGYEHNVRGKDRVHLMQKITDYFDANL